MTESIRTWETDDWGIAVSVLTIESWEGLDAIAKFFRKRFRAAYVDDVEGLDSRVIVLRIRGKEVRLVHDEMLGNEFYSRDPSAESLVLELAEAVKEAIDVGTLRDPCDGEQGAMTEAKHKSCVAIVLVSVAIVLVTLFCAA